MAQSGRRDGRLGGDSVLAETVDQPRTLVRHPHFVIQPRATINVGQLLWAPGPRTQVMLAPTSLVLVSIKLPCTQKVSSASLHAGKLTMKQLRPSSITPQRASPPWRRAICRTKAKPSPVPPRSRASVGR